MTFSGEFCPKLKRETTSLSFVVSIFKIHLINSSMLAILDASSMSIEKSQCVGLDLLKFSFLSFPSAPRKVKLVSHSIKFKCSTLTKFLSTTDFPKIYAWAPEAIKSYEGHVVSNIGRIESILSARLSLVRESPTKFCVKVAINSSCTAQIWYLSQRLCADVRW